MKENHSYYLPQTRLYIASLYCPIMFFVIWKWYTNIQKKKPPKQWEVWIVLLKAQFYLVILPVLNDSYCAHLQHSSLFPRHTDILIPRVCPEHIGPVGLWSVEISVDLLPDLNSHHLYACWLVSYHITNQVLRIPVRTQRKEIWNTAPWRHTAIVPCG